MGEIYGLIAGRGKFPLILAENVRKRGHEIVVVAIKQEADPSIEKLASRVYWLSMTQLGKIIKVLKKENIKRAFMLGMVMKRRMYTSEILKLDLTAARLWKSLPDRRGDTILRAVADELSNNGIELEDSTLFLKPCLAGKDVMTKRRPTAAEAADIEFGYRMAKIIAEHDIGQSVVVKRLSVVAVEAVEGTDECILRSGALSGKGFTVVKVSRKNHDMRFDVPVVGSLTLKKMKQAGGTVLAVEAGKTLIVDREQFLKDAEESGISVVGI